MLASRTGTRCSGEEVAAKLTNSGDGGVLILDLVGGAEHLLDVHVVAERRWDNPEDAGDRVTVRSADEAVTAQRRAHQAIPVPLCPGHGRRASDLDTQKVARAEDAGHSLGPRSWCEWSGVE
jgi:hypothetical protein